MPPELDRDLRTRLVAVGVELLAGEGIETLSLREVARRAGVSHGAPRRYFPTHQALLAAIAMEGYRDLGRRIAERVHVDGPDPYDQILVLGRLYLDFASGNPEMFALMFRHDLLRGNGIGLRAASQPLFGVLVHLVGRARPATPDARPATVVAGALWANWHGLAQLWRWGSLQTTVRTDDVEPLLRTTLAAHVADPVHHR